MEIDGLDSGHVKTLLSFGGVFARKRDGARGVER